MIQYYLRIKNNVICQILLKRKEGEYNAWNWYKVTEVLKDDELLSAGAIIEITEDSFREYFSDIIDFKESLGELLDFNLN